MAQRYVCQKCKTIYDAQTQDGMCAQDACFGEPLLPYNGPGSVSGAESATKVVNGQLVMEGLCVLVCDVSGSMSTAAFAESPVTKLQLVVNAVQRAVDEFKDLSKKDTAYIAIVAFGGRAKLITDKQGAPFIKSIQGILEDYGDGLARYLHDYFENDQAGLDRGHTDISSGLQLANSIVQGALAGDLSQWGIGFAIKLMPHSDIVRREGGQISVPNVRVMAYSDGAHNAADGSELSNPFQRMTPASVLMTAFIGDEAADASALEGAEQMKALATTCPEHGMSGYFLINSLARHARLRDVFRMASGASGFCPQCVPKRMPSFEAAV